METSATAGQHGANIGKEPGSRSGLEITLSTVAAGEMYDYASFIFIRLVSDFCQEFN